MTTAIQITAGNLWSQLLNSGLIVVVVAPGGSVTMGKGRASFTHIIIIYLNSYMESYNSMPQFPVILAL